MDVIRTPPTQDARGEMEEEDIGLTSGQHVGHKGRAWTWGPAGVGMVVGFGLGLLLAAAISLHFPSRSIAFIAQHASPHALAAGQTALSFLVVGDWGRNGDYNQSIVAEAMGKVAAGVDSSFVVSTGDNFYEDGLEDVDDPQFTSSFSEIYQAPSLRTQWYAVLGNHDYHGNPDAQTDPVLRRRDPRWRCDRSFIVRRDACPQFLYEPCEAPVELLFIDTSPLVKAYWSQEGEEPLNFTGQKDYSLRFHLQSLKAALGSLTAKWKIVVGHHPIRSTGEHGNTHELLRYVYPLLTEHGVDLYVNGHDHNLELIKDPFSPLYFVTSGAGSMVRQNRSVTFAEEQASSLFFYSLQGFVSVTVFGDTLHLRFHDAFGGTLFSLPINK